MRGKVFPLAALRCGYPLRLGALRPLKPPPRHCERSAAIHNLEYQC